MKTIYFLALAVAGTAILSSSPVSTTRTWSGISGSLTSSQGEEIPALGTVALKHRYFQRLSEDGTISPSAMMRAITQRDLILQSQESNIASPTWSFLGPNNVGGRIRAIITHPTNASIMWLGSVGGGIWKTTNGGTSWAPQNDFLPSLCISSMVIDKNNPNVLYAGSGESYFDTSFGENNKAAIQGAGIYKTTDGGTNWTRLSATAIPDFNCVSRLTMSPTDPNTLLASTNAGIFRTTDGGVNWTKVYNGKVYDVDFNPTDATKAVAGLPVAPGVIWSSDGGATWSNSTGIGTMIRSETCWSKSVAGNVYAGVANGGFVKVWKSTDYGHTWTVKTTSSGTSCYEAYNVTLWVDPTNDNNLILAGVNGTRSTNQGVSLTSSFGNVHSDWHGVTEAGAFNGSTNRQVFFATDGGIFRSNDYTVSAVTALNNSLGITQFYGGAVNDTSGRVMAGAQDNYTQVYTGSLNWTGVIGGDGVYCASDPSFPSTFYAGYYYMNVFRDDGTLNFPTDATAGISDRGTEVNCNFIPYITLDPNQSNTMIACARRLWRSTNVRTGNPPTWTIIKAPIGNEPPNDHPWREAMHSDHFAPEMPYNISTATVAKGNSNVIWAGHNNGQLFMTTNGTAVSPSWMRVDLNGPLPSRWISTIVIDNNDSNHVYVAYMGFEQDNIWETTDAGATFHQVTGTGLRQIPAAPVDSLALDPLRPGHLIAGTDIGIFTSWDNGATWSVDTQGPGTVPIDMLAWRNNSQLMVYTYGRGAWQGNVSPVASSVQPSSFAIVRGIPVSGGLADVLSSDDSYLTVKNGLVLNPTESPVTIEFTGFSPSTIASTITINCEASVTTGGLLRKIQAYNYDTATWVELDSRSATTSDQVVNATISTSVSSFINPSNREMKMRFLVKSGGIVGSATWNGKVDLVNWTVNQ